MFIEVTKYKNGVIEAIILANMNGGVPLKCWNNGGKASTYICLSPAEYIVKDTTLAHALEVYNKVKQELTEGQKVFETVVENN